MKPWVAAFAPYCSCACCSSKLYRGSPPVTASASPRFAAGCWPRRFPPPRSATAAAAAAAEPVRLSRASQGYSPAISLAPLSSPAAVAPPCSQAWPPFSLARSCAPLPTISHVGEAAAQAAQAPVAFVWSLVVERPPAATLGGHVAFRQLGAQQARRLPSAPCRRA